MNPAFTSGSPNNITMPNGQIVDRTALDRPPVALNAQIPGTPTKAVAPSAVISSQPAQDHIAKLGTAITTANTDLANQTQTNAQNKQNASAYEIPLDKPIPGDSEPDYTKQISDILGGIGNAENYNGTPDQQQSIADDQAGIDTLQPQLDQANQTLTSMASGTYPLSASEQASVANVATIYSGALQDAEDAAQNLIGGTTVSNAKNGLQMYSPEEAKSNIAKAVIAGGKKIATINGNIIDAQAKMTQAFQDQDFKSATAYASQLNSMLKERQDSITTMNTAIQKEQDKLVEMQKDRLTAIMDDNTISHQEKQDALAQSTLDEKTKADLASEATAREVAMKGVYNRDADGTIYDTRTGKVVASPNDSMPIGSVTPGNTGNPLVDANTKTTGSGIPYIDGTNLTGAQATSAQLVAAKAGIPYMGKDAASALNNIQAAKNDFQLISDSVKDLNPGGLLNTITLGGSRLANTIVHGIENKMQIGPGSEEVGSFNAYKESAIKAIQALASGGTGLRINQAEIGTMMTLIPSYNDTKEVAQSKLDKLSSMLDNNEKSLIGEKYYNTYNPNSASSYAGVTLPGGESSQTGSSYEGITLPN